MTKRRGKTNNKLEVKIGKKKTTKHLPAIIDNIEFDDEKTAKDKKLFMWVGVSCLMVVFFIVWIFSLKYEFKVSLNKGAKSGFDWNQTKIELDKAMTQVKQGLAEIKKIQASSNQIASSSQPKLTAEQIDSLKGKLLNEVASSTATSTKK